MRLNGITPPVGTLLSGIEPLVVTETDGHGAVLRLATTNDYMAANLRKPAEIHSVYEHHLIPPRQSIFGLIRVMG